MNKEASFDFGWLDFSWADKHLFWLLLVLPFLVVWYYYIHYKRSQAIRFSSLNAIASSGWNSIPALLFSLRLLALGVLILAFARPQLQEDETFTRKSAEGIDIVMALDISGSMMAEDFKPNRLVVAKEVAINFIKERPNDRIGLVVYEGQAFTQCPLTTDHNVLIRLFNDVEPGMIQDGTAIGMGLATAVNRLKESDGKSKVVILLTDGVNNQGNIDPLTAAEIAREFGVRVYTIGVGKNGKAPFPAIDPFGRKVRTMMDVKIDEPMMKSIAEMTGGKYFRAENREKLESIYKEIDQLEKTLIKVTEFRVDPPEKFHSILLIGMLLLAAEFLLRHFIFRMIHE